ATGPRSTSTKFAVVAVVALAAAGWLVYTQVWGRGGTHPLAWTDVTTKVRGLQLVHREVVVIHSRRTLAKGVREAMPGRAAAPPAPPPRHPRPPVNGCAEGTVRGGPRANETRGRAKRLVLFAVRLGELVRGDVLEVLLELADDLLLVHFAVLELDRGLLDHLFGREDGSLGPDGQGNRVG